MKHIYDLIIVGGGITGASLLYAVSRYSNIKSVLLLEKYDALAPLNSNSRNNAQTLHFGDIETNYSRETATRTNEAAHLLLRYTEKMKEAERARIIQRCQKMVLAVGDFEIGLLDKTYSNISTLFPTLRKIGRKEIARLEPNVVKGRDQDEKIEALLSKDGYMVDFGLLTKSFVTGARQNKRIKIDIRFNVRVIRPDREADYFKITTDRGDYFARYVVFSTGAYSLYFAKLMGYDKNLSVLSVAGNFYYSRRVLNGKVYRVQIGGIPFAAVHGDPEITNPNVTRFGPTVALPLVLEKGHGETFSDYMRTFDFDLPTLISMKNIIFNKDIERILAKNLSYSLPFVGKANFLHNEAARIVPSLKNRDLWLAKGIGGIRPQIIDENKRSLVLGEAKLKEDGIIFNVTPSPGATSCLSGAVADVKSIVEYLGRDFNEKLFENELGKVNHNLKHR
jgi:malate dehydrogenase (quinone)